MNPINPLSVAAATLLAGALLFGHFNVTMTASPSSAEAQFMPQSDPKLAAARAKLAEQAQTLIPMVKAQQPERLAAFQADHQSDVDAFSFRCERFGDFLSVFIERRNRNYDPVHNKSPRAVTKMVMAIRLADAASIVLKLGSDPDLGGKSEFVAENILREGGEKWTEELAIDGADLPSVGKKAVGWSGHMVGDTSNQLGVSVDGIARPAEDDIITFGQGGGTYSPQQWSGNMPAPTQLPGATISTPSGEGPKIYAEILAALRNGAPAVVHLP
jgi:hypothetical protein